MPNSSSKLHRCAIGIARYSIMSQWIDATLSPDVDPLDALVSLAESVDFVARLCAAWDFGIIPYPATLDEICRYEWREAVAACRLLTAHIYHLLRRWLHLEPVPYLGRNWPIFAMIPTWPTSRECWCERHVPPHLPWNMDRQKRRICRATTGAILDILPIPVHQQAGSVLHQPRLSRDFIHPRGARQRTPGVWFPTNAGYIQGAMARRSLRSQRRGARP